MSGEVDEPRDHESVYGDGPGELGVPVDPPASQETSFEVELDEEPLRRHEPLYVDVVSRDEPERRPIVPAKYMPQNIKATTKRFAGRQAYRAGYHGPRLPLVYAPLGTFWALVGLGRLVGRLIYWTFDMHARPLQHAAVRREDVDEWLKIVRQRSARAGRRLFVVGLLALLAAIGVGLFVWLAPGWVQALVVLCAIPGLAHIGRPDNRPIVRSAVVAPQHRKLNSDIVLRAYYAAKLGDPDKKDQQIDFLSTMSDVAGRGAKVLVGLPFGRTFDDAMNARGKIASGLDVSVSQVYLTRNKKSHRSHWLYISYVDPLAVPAGRTPLLDCKPRDIWQPCPLGVDELSQRVAFCLVFQSLLVGAQPRKGKTFTARAVALFAALDPYVRLSVFDGKGSPDWRKFALVAYTFGFGLLPDRVQGEPIDTLRATLREIKKDVLRRNQKLSELPTNICPEGKLTRDIARDAKFGMPVWVLVLDEFQEYLNTGDEEADLEIADNLLFIVKVGPSVGIFVLSSTQKPSGLGSTGKVAKRFTDYRDQHQARFALKTGSYNVSNAILGDAAYSDGYDASALPAGDEYRGIGILYDAPCDSATVRTYLADGEDAEKILLAARRHRERAGRLEGMAAGDEVARQFRDVLADVRSVFYAGEAWISWAQLAGRMAEQMPEHYADLTKEAISAQVRGLGAKEKKGRDKGGDSLWGVPRVEVEKAAERREIEGRP